MILQELYINSLESFFTEFLLGFMILILLLFSSYYRHYHFIKDILSNNNNICLFILFLIFLLQMNVKNYQILPNGLFYTNYFISCLKLLLIISTINLFIIQKKYIKNQYIIFFENNILILISLLGLLLLISSQNFLSFYLALELQSLSFYILALSKRNSIYSVEAALKYFILGAIGTGFILFGISHVYGISGTLDFNQLYQMTSELNFISDNSISFHFIFGFFFFIVGIFFKLGAAPFHMWLPDVYEGSPNHISLFFATTPKIAFIGFLLNFFFHHIFYILSFFETFIYQIALLSMIIGTLGTFSQLKMKRFLGYSAIAHIGFILLGFIILTPETFRSIIFYLITYTIMSIHIWNIYLSIFFNEKPIKYLTDLTQFYMFNKFISFSIFINFFSMSGIPPLMGFFSKMILFKSILENHLYFILFVSILLSIVSAFYYLRIIKIIYFDKQIRNLFLNTFSKEQAFLISFTSHITLFFFFFPNFFITFIDSLYLMSF